VVPGGLDLAAIRRMWEDLLELVSRRNKSARALLRNAEPVSVDDKTLQLRFDTPELSNLFERRASFLREALRELVGADLAVVAITGRPSARDEPDNVVDITGDADEEQAAVDAMALLQRDLGARVIPDGEGS
jgi:hypothetical protein